MSFNSEKAIVRSYQAAFDEGEASDVKDVVKSYVDENAKVYACYPFDECSTPAELVKGLWEPLKQSFTRMKRREDVFMAGNNSAGEGKWVMSMGHFAGLFDKPFLGIRSTGKLAFLRYAEFFEVRENKIVSHAIFFDLIALMQQVGLNPLPVETGHTFVYPGPCDHNGLLFEEQDPLESKKTIELVEEMVSDLDSLNKSGNDNCPPELLAKCWSEDMVWYGPAGIGATYTIECYQQQHQFPFRKGLKDKVFNGHVARFSEGGFACFFGWPNLSNTAGGGLFGMPASGIRADMRVVDVYYRKGDKLLENWVLMDVPYWLKQQGLDILSRTTTYS